MTKKNKPGIVFFGIKYFPSQGGTSRVAESLIRLLCDDYNILIYCYKNKKAKDNIPGVKTIQIKEINFGNPGVFIYYFLCTIHMLIFVNRKYLVHAHKTDCAFFLPLLRLKFKTIATSHEAPYKRDKWNRLGRIYFYIMEWFFIHSGAILTSISLPLKKYYEEKYSKKVKFIPNGINTDTEVSVSDAEEILKKHSIEGEYYLFAARRIMSTKGCHTMLEALIKMKSKTPIVIAGDENHAPEYMNILKTKYASLNLKFIGFVASLPSLMGLIEKAKLFIFPSETEGMSMMLLEVSNSGTRIIASDIPENTQVFNSDEMLYFRNKDADDLKEKIEFALANPQIMDEKSRMARHKINQYYRWTKIISSYKELYELHRR